MPTREFDEDEVLIMPDSWPEGSEEPHGFMPINAIRRLAPEDVEAVYVLDRREIKSIEGHPLDDDDHPPEIQTLAVDLRNGERLKVHNHIDAWIEWARREELFRGDIPENLE